MGGGFAYLFERFPSFTQTFCFREVLEMRCQGVRAPVFSIRTPKGEPEQNFPPELEGLTTYLPESFDIILTGDSGFRRRARKAIEDLRGLWGGEGEKRRIYEALWLLPRLRAAGVTHLHVHFAGTAARTAFWLNRLGGLRYSITAHANDIFCDEPRERLEMMFASAERVVTVSDFSARWLQSHFPGQAAKIRRVYNGIDVRRFYRAEETSDPPVIVGVGRYIEKKGFADLIAACGRLRAIDFFCRIVGDGPLEADLRTRAAGDGRIAITGALPERAIVGELASATAFVLPCVDGENGGKDNLPTVIMEAMAAALPVISTRLAGIPEMVVDGETGFLVDPGDVEGVAARLRELLRDPVRARAMGDAGAARCREMFATERTTEDLRRVLEECGAFEGRKKGWIGRLFG